MSFELYHSVKKRGKHCFSAKAAKFCLLAGVNLILVCASGCGKSDTSNLQKDDTKMEIVHLSQSGFEQMFGSYDFQNRTFAYSGQKPAIVDFYASWCGPCKMLSPVLEDLAVEYKDKINIYKVDVDAEQNLAAMLSIRSVPTLLFITRKGEGRAVQGAIPKYELAKLIDTFLLSNPQK